MIVRLVTQAAASSLDLRLVVQNGIAGPLSSNSVSVSDLGQIQNVAVHLLGGRVQLVPQKDNANLMVQTRMYQTKNYAVRNSKHEPAHGLVMISVCRFPIVTMASDCENLTFYYFADYQANDIFENVFTLWLNSVFPTSTK